MSSFLTILLVVSATEAVQPIIYQLPENHPVMQIELTPRSPNQMGSFYEARGFPRPMLETLKKQCFITVGITNLSQHKIWLDMKRWTFSVNGKPLERKTRSEWTQYWQSKNMPKNKRATFRWTIIPESLDYLPGEREGGNVVLPFTKEYITLEASFATGEDQQGNNIHFKTDKLYCAEDAE